MEGYASSPEERTLIFDSDEPASTSLTKIYITQSHYYHAISVEIAKQTKILDTKTVNS